MRKPSALSWMMVGALGSLTACQRSPDNQPPPGQHVPLSLTGDLGLGGGGASVNVTVTLDVVTAQVVATGIPGAGAVTQVGTFHLGGPFHDNAAFAPATAPGQILDGARLLVASAFNFGQPLGRADQAPGALLSIDPSGHGLLGGPMSIAPDFASGGGQASTASGHVTLYAANNLAFSNSLFSPTAATANEVSTSLPLGISLNNAFGRPWIANAPTGNSGNGTVSILDPNGAPFKGPPDPVAGGVFAGDLTDRSTSSTHGLTGGTVATALLTKSPDGSGRAVFLAANADGSVVQVHVQLGVDGLAPAGSFTPLPGITTTLARSAQAADVTRVGMVFNWVPRPTVFISDPLGNRILVLDLGNDGTLFTASTRYLTPGQLDRPTDLAPTSVETAARNFASNTTLGAGSDIYVLNRGNNSVLRMTQQGTLVAGRQVLSTLLGFRLAGIAVSPDGRTIWLTATLPGEGGALLSIPAFGGGNVTSALFSQANQVGANGDVAQGGFIFSHAFTTGEDLGPLFNGQSCVSCHNNPATAGAGLAASTFVTRFGQLVNGAYDSMASAGGPIARTHSVSEMGVSCGLVTGVPAAATVRSLRSAMTLRGTALIDTILDRAILAGQAAEPVDLRGHANVLADGRVGKFGWKAAIPTLVEFMGEALRDEVGLTNPLLPTDLVSGCGANDNGAEIDGVPLTSLVAFLDTVDPATPTAACLGSGGAVLFNSVGCAGCHTPSLPGPGTPTASQKPVRLYSDLLLHDLGPALADNVQQAGAGGSEFRTAPLWGAADRRHFLHDGRAATLTDAIAAHGGQAATASAAFSALSPTDQQALLAFLGCI